MGYHLQQHHKQYDKDLSTKTARRGDVTRDTLSRFRLSLLEMVIPPADTLGPQEIPVLPAGSTSGNIRMLSSVPSTTTSTAATTSTNSQNSDVATSITSSTAAGSSSSLSFTVTTASVSQVVSTNPLNAFVFVSPTYSSEGQSNIVVADTNSHQNSTRSYNCTICHGANRYCKNKKTCVYYPTCFRSPADCSFRRNMTVCNASQEILNEQTNKRKLEKQQGAAERAKRSRANRRGKVVQANE